MSVEIPLDRIRDPALRAIARKVNEGVPVDSEDARTMLTTSSILDAGLMAHAVRTVINGRRVYYGVNMNLNYTNVCTLRCPLCAYSRDAGDPDAYTLGLDEIERRVRAAAETGIDEVHIVGGLNPALPLDYYLEMVRRVKAVRRDLFVVAFTAVEYDFFSNRFGLPLEELFRLFRDAGLGALPGGGAEIFSPGVRGVIAPRKIPGERWLEVMRTAHGAGLRTNATMLYGHVEGPGDVADHLSRLRSLQEETGGFKAFVPLAYHGEKTALGATRMLTGYDAVRLYAAARVFLNNIPHIRALWMYLGEKMAQVLLHFGVDDIGATYRFEKVVHAAGARTPDFGTEEHLHRLIGNAGMEPVRVSADYTRRS